MHVFIPLSEIKLLCQNISPASLITLFLKRIMFLKVVCAIRNVTETVLYTFRAQHYPGGFNEWLEYECSKKK